MYHSYAEKIAGILREEWDYDNLLNTMPDEKIFEIGYMLNNVREATEELSDKRVQSDIHEMRDMIEELHNEIL